MNADGSNQTRVTNDPAKDVSREWSPNDKSVVVQLRKRDNNMQIQIMKEDGTELHLTQPY